MSDIRELNLGKVNLTGETQCRIYLDEDVIRSYAEDMDNGAVFPPVTVFWDGETYWLSDGFHRVHARGMAGFGSVAACVMQGTQRDAILHGIAANAQHGLQRTREDKRNAVVKILKDKEWKSWSDRKIATHCSVSHSFVADVRKRLEQGPAEPRLPSIKLAPELTLDCKRHYSRLKARLTLLADSATSLSKVQPSRQSDISDALTATINAVEQLRVLFQDE